MQTPCRRAHGRPLFPCSRPGLNRASPSPSRSTLRCVKQPPGRPAWLNSSRGRALTPLMMAMSRHLPQNWALQFCCIPPEYSRQARSPTCTDELLRTGGWSLTDRPGRARHTLHSGLTRKRNLSLWQNPGGPRHSPYSAPEMVPPRSDFRTCAAFPGAAGIMAVGWIHPDHWAATKPTKCRHIPTRTGKAKPGPAQPEGGMPTSVESGTIPLKPDQPDLALKSASNLWP